MGGTPTYRESNRARLREALVAAARELTVAHGWEGVRMADVAGAAGVSRQTVYNEFGGRDGLAEALALEEMRQFVAMVRAEMLAHGGDARKAAQAAIARALLEAARNPLVRAILTSGRGGADELLPYLTTRSAALLAAGGEVIAEWAAEHRPEIAPERVALAADSTIRLTISHVLQPLATPEASAEAVAEVFVRLLED
jgi:AcrR family transcriptional regulator